MNKARRLKAKELLANDPTLTPKDAYKLTRKYKFVGELKKALTEKGLDVSIKRQFSQEELLVVQSTLEEMRAKELAPVEAADGASQV